MTLLTFSMGQEKSLAALVAALSALAHCVRGQAALSALAHCMRGQALYQWAEARGRALTLLSLE